LTRPIPSKNQQLDDTIMMHNNGSEMRDSKLGSTYTTQGEAKRIFKLILHDSRLNAPPEVKALESTVSFVGEETQPLQPNLYHNLRPKSALKFSPTATLIPGTS
jgi:hypothetical protein